MKHLTIAAVFAALVSPAFAGGYDETVMEEPVTAEMIETDTASSNGGILVPIMALIFFAVAASN